MGLSQGPKKAAVSQEPACAGSLRLKLLETSSRRHPVQGSSAHYHSRGPCGAAEPTWKCAFIKA